MADGDRADSASGVGEIGTPESAPPLLEDGDGAPFPALVQDFVALAWRWAHGWTDIISQRKWRKFVSVPIPNTNSVWDDESWADMTQGEAHALLWLREVPAPSTPVGSQREPWTCPHCGCTDPAPAVVMDPDGTRRASCDRCGVATDAGRTTEGGAL